MMKKTLAILLAVILLLGTAAAAPVSAGAATAKSYITETQRISLQYLASDGTTKTYTYAVPQLKLDSEYAVTVNEKLLSHCNNQITRFEYAYSQGFAIRPDIGYQCYLYQDILCIILYTNNYNMFNYSMWEYKINVKTGEKVVNNDILALAGVTRAEADQRLIALIDEDLKSSRCPEAPYYASYGQRYVDVIVNEKLPAMTHYSLDDSGALRAMIYGTWKEDGVQIGYCLNNALIREPARSYVLGDADADGRLSVMDATAIQRKLAKLGTRSFDETAADADEDGKVTVLDATAIQRRLAKLKTHAGIGELKTS